MRLTLCDLLTHIIILHMQIALLMHMNVIGQIWDENYLMTVIMKIYQIQIKIDFLHEKSNDLKYYRIENIGNELQHIFSRFFNSKTYILAML